MLKEFAFTPQVFDPTANPANPNWRECIQAIAVRLFTQSATPVVVAGLHAGASGCSWEHAARETIAGIQDANLRIEAEHLFTRMSGVLVPRPPCCDWPGEDEPGWGKEAADSHAIEPLHQIVAQQLQSVPASAPTSAFATALSPSFWTTLQQEAPLPTTLAEDVARLRSVLVHSECLVLSVPYLSTTDFAMECIRQAVRRPTGYVTPVIHVHQAHASGANQSSRVAWLRNELGALAGRSIVRWWLWPDVAMTHVWGEGNLADAEPATYSLLSVLSAKRHSDMLDGRIAALKLSPVML